MNSQLPEAFLNRMKNQLGDELECFMRAMNGSSVHGIRFNPLKPCAENIRWMSGDRIPWEKNGWYLPDHETPGRTIWHEAGAFYLQDPAAMIPVNILDPKPGETILDLCSAPGGKATQIGCAMQGEGLLVCNEIVPKRALILSRNIERIGITNAVVTGASPNILASRWKNGFDAVLADAPCSGEGMFRRDPDTRNEWSPEQASGCVQRQREILNAAAELVRPGGRLVYSTCTYNPEENDDNAEWFVSRFPEFNTEAFSLPGICAPEGRYTCYPHCVKGEGQYIAKFRKEGNKAAFLPVKRLLPTAPTTEKNVFEKAFPMLPAATHKLGNTLAALTDLPDLEGIRVIRAGLHLGEVRGKTAVPDHAAALSIYTPEMQAVDLSSEQALRYAAGETIPGKKEGWLLIRYRGLVIGWGKGSQGIIKNHYPKGLRSIRYTI